MDELKLSDEEAKKLNKYFNVDFYWQNYKYIL